jgi:hypothetical protein
MNQTPAPFRYAALLNALVLGTLFILFFAGGMIMFSGTKAMNTFSYIATPTNRARQTAPVEEDPAPTGNQRSPSPATAGGSPP